jgi:uncharacterized BrkB/YihY/UPF0761 family membrane protein
MSDLNKSGVTLHLAFGVMLVTYVFSYIETKVNGYIPIDDLLNKPTQLAWSGIIVSVLLLTLTVIYIKRVRR